MELKEIISSGFLELYALGVTSPEETLQVEAWTSQYSEVRKELDEIQSSMEEYAMAHAVTPNSALRERIMAEIGLATNQDGDVIPVQGNDLTAKQPGSSEDNSRQKAVVYTMNSYFKWAAAACFVLLLGSLALAYSFYNKYQSANNDLAQVKTDLSTQKELAKNIDQQISVVTDKNSLPISLNGTPHAPDASAKIFWMKNTGDVYVAPGALPDAPSGKQYQLWAIVDGQPVDAGMISNAKGETFKIQKMKSFGKAQAFAITLEKEGGSPKPTMEEMFVIATI